MTLTLYEKCVFYDRIISDMPIVIIMDGWDGAVQSNPMQLERMARTYNACFCSTARRGYWNTNGTRDASGREIQDIVDGVTAIKAKYPTLFSDKVSIIGTSGGGGNALAAACKFPDMWNVVVSIFGMSDYGRDAINGWYQQNSSYRDSVALSVGGTPIEVPNNYYARDATTAVKNYTGGKLYLFHDEADNIVKPIHSARIETSMSEIGNCTKYLSLTTDTIRYQHTELTIGDSNWLDIESKIMFDILNQSAWTISASGTIIVIGYVVTKRFTIWLNSGLDAAATVIYDTDLGTYIVTPLTNNPIIAVTITQGAKTANGNINGETLFTVA